MAGKRRSIGGFLAQVKFSILSLESTMFARTDQLSYWASGPVNTVM